MVNDTKTTLQSHVDSHLVLGDGVHGGRDEGSLESDALGDRSIERHRRGSEANVAGKQQEVVVGETAVLGSIHELVEIESIVALVLLEDVEGCGMVEDLGSTVEGRHCDISFYGKKGMYKKRYEKRSEVEDEEKSIKEK